MEKSKCVISNSPVVFRTACGHHARLLSAYGQISQKNNSPIKLRNIFFALTRCMGNMRPACMVWKMFFFMQIYSGHSEATCAMPDTGFRG